jgi:hypothetical protein
LIKPLHSLRREYRDHPKITADIAGEYKTLQRIWVHNFWESEKSLKDVLISAPKEANHYLELYALFRQHVLISAVTNYLV